MLFAYRHAKHFARPGNFLVSDNIHGLAAQFLEKHLGGGVVTLEFAGASVNIDPWVRVLPDFRTTNGWVPEPVLMGTMLGEDVPMRPSCAEGGYEVQSSPFAPAPANNSRKRRRGGCGN